MNNPQTILGIDVGGARIGVARISTMARLPEPLPAIKVDGTELEQLKALIKEHQIDILAVGLPRSLQGNETEQTKTIRAFTDKLKQFNLPIYLQDEALTSKQAEAELQTRKKPYSKGEIDSLAAAYIAEDFIVNQL